MKIFEHRPPFEMGILGLPIFLVDCLISGIFSVFRPRL